MRFRRRWWVVALVGALGVGGVVVALTRSGSSGCSSAATGVGSVPGVFASPASTIAQSDPRLRRLITAVQSSGLGRVIGAVGYDQTRWLRSAALPDGFATWTTDNAVVGFRDTAGRIRWGLRQTRDPQAWAAVAGAFVSLDLQPSRPVRVASYDAQTGAMRWCALVGKATKYGDPLTVAPGAQGSMWVGTAGPTLDELNARGEVTRSMPIKGVDRAAYVREVGSLLIVGGRASHLLAAPDPKLPGPAGPVVTAFDARTMRMQWQWGRGRSAHVVGENGGLLMVEVAEPQGLTVIGLDLNGRQRWRTSVPPGTTADMALVSGTLLVRTADTISGYEPATGARRWTRALGRVFPDGFELDAQPTLGSKVLLATKSALIALDPATGNSARYALPTDGSAPTFWPYEVVISGRSAIVETNAGAVLVALPAR